MTPPPTLKLLGECAQSRVGTPPIGLSKRPPTLPPVRLCWVWVSPRKALTLYAGSIYTATIDGQYIALDARRSSRTALILILTPFKNKCAGRVLDHRPTG